MATVLKQHHMISHRTLIQKTCIAVGIFFVAAGLIGIVMPGFLGMHLSFAHNMIHLVSGAFSLWCGYSEDPKRAYGFAMGFGIVYGLLGLAGFVLGEPGYPGVGHMEADENLLRVIPNALEFGTMDHVVHILLSAILLLSVYAWLKKREDMGRRIVETQGRTGAGSPTDVFRKK